MPTTLVTGATGYIGSHVVLALLEAGHEVVAVDDLSNSSPESLRRVSQLTGREAAFHEVSVLDRVGLTKVFASHEIDTVVHLAGLKAVGDSVADPLSYYEVNLGGSMNLVRVMAEYGVFRLVFSSSATVYGEGISPFAETDGLGAVNPYGRTKEIQEYLFGDVAASGSQWRIALLWYFNPVGAHVSGRIGEDPVGKPNNLVPFVMQTAAGRHEQVTIHGDDYATIDGTGVRDYIHVVDLAAGHLAALGALDTHVGCRAWNLGSGVGSSVKEVMAAAERAVGQPIPHQVGPRRPGDVAEAVADVSRANDELAWTTQRTLDDMVTDHWRWQQSNPQGYTD